MKVKLLTIIFLWSVVAIQAVQSPTNSFPESYTKSTAETISETTTTCPDSASNTSDYSQVTIDHTSALYTVSEGQGQVIVDQDGNIVETDQSTGQYNTAGIPGLTPRSSLYSDEEGKVGRSGWCCCK